MSDQATAVKPLHPERCALVVASGMGRRMGGPKALLLWDGVPLAVAHARARSADCDRAIVVTREPIAEALLRADPTLSIVVSREPDELGAAGSIAAAVRAGALGGAEQVLVTPVDVAPAQTSTVRKVLEALSKGEASRPRLRGLPGHPVACRASRLAAWYAKEAVPLRDRLASLGSLCLEVDVDDPDVLVDFDTIEAFEARTGRKAAFWR